MKRTREPYVSHQRCSKRTMKRNSIQRKCCCGFDVRVSVFITRNQGFEYHWTGIKTFFMNYSLQRYSNPPNPHPAYAFLPHTMHLFIQGQCSGRRRRPEGRGGVSANAPMHPQTRLLTLSSLCVLIMPHWSSAIAKRMMERLVWRLACGDGSDCKTMGVEGGGECYFPLRLCTLYFEEKQPRRNAIPIA